MGGKSLRLQCPSKTVSVGSVGSPGEKDGPSWLQDSPSCRNQSVLFLNLWLGAVDGEHGFHVNKLGASVSYTPCCRTPKRVSGAKDQTVSSWPGWNPSIWASWEMPLPSGAWPRSLVQIYTLDLPSWAERGAEQFLLVEAFSESSWERECR